MSVCLSCSSNDSNLLYDFGELPAVNKFFSQDDVGSEKKYPLVLNYCKVCFLVQIEEVPPAEDLYQDYHHKSSASAGNVDHLKSCLLYTSPSPRDRQKSRMPSSA